MWEIIDTVGASITLSGKNEQELDEIRPIIARVSLARIRGELILIHKDQLVIEIVQMNSASSILQIEDWMVKK